MPEGQKFALQNSSKYAIMGTDFSTLPWMVVALLIIQVKGVCYDQSPFWFISQPKVESLYDEQGNMLSNKVRVKWGNMQNFKCVDYFQVEYFQKLAPDTTVLLTPRIERFMRHYDIDVEPCTEYTFKIAASEDYQGRRDDFKSYSGLVSYKLDYTPRFTSSPSVKELKIRPDRRGGRRGHRSPALASSATAWQNDQQESDSPGEEEEAKDPVMLRVSWRIQQIDYPTCLDYFVLDYYDITYNESTFSKTINRPFPSNGQIQVDIHSDTVPCDPEFRHILRVFGLTGAETSTDWNPRSCVLTTPAPTTTVSAEVAGIGQAETLEALLEENDQLRAKIEGLNEEYAKIGLEVFKAFTEDFFRGLEVSVASRHDNTNATDIQAADE